MTDDVVLTPGGYRPRSAVHSVEANLLLDGTASRYRLLRPSGETAADFGEIPHRPGNRPVMPANVARAAKVVPEFGSGWITYTGWTNTTGNPISSFSTTWVVPPAPATQNGQTIFLFNGIQNSTMIYQPVLQWGGSAAGGGNYWSVASWYVNGSGGAAFHSPLVRVNPGDTLTGVMTLTGQSGGQFSYNCEFQGIADTGWSIQNVQELTWCIETLEAYGITTCSDYPDTDSTVFRAISIQTGASTPALGWTPEDTVTDCGQHAVVASNANPNGEVDLFYRNPPSWHRFTLAPGGSAAVTAKIKAVSRIPNSMEMWWTGADGSVQDAYWYDGGNWQRFALEPSGRAALAGGMTAVSRVQNSMETWWIGPDGSVQDAYWYDGANWQNFTLAGPGSASLGGGIKAVSRIQNSMELWWVGPDGSVHDAYWYDGGTWQNFQLAGPGSAAQQSGIAGVSRIPTSMEIWWIGPDGSVHDAYWYDGANWQNFQLAGPASASVKGGITAVSRVPNSMEVWWIGPDGSVHDAYWYDGGTWQDFQLAPPGSASPQGGITAVSRIPNSMEVWWIGPDGSVQDAFWYEGATWQRFQLAPAGSASPQGGITAVSRIPNSMEVWWIGPDGSVQDAYWYG
jgi:hypothetical protein